jgi:hypothetical protein
LIKFLEANNEYLIAKYVEHNIYVKLVENQLELTINKSYDDQIIKKLVQKYFELTGQKIVVKNVNFDDANKTIKEQDAIERQKIIDEFKDSDEFAQIKKLFPDIKINN